MSINNIWRGEISVYMNDVLNAIEPRPGFSNYCPAGGLQCPIFRQGDRVAEFWHEVVRVARLSGAKRPKMGPKAPYQKILAMFLQKKFIKNAIQNKKLGIKGFECFSKNFENLFL